LLEATDSQANEQRIDQLKRAITDDDRRHFLFMRQQLRSAQYQYFILCDQFNKNAERFQTPTNDACDRNFYM
jgi:hypothetical protein